MSVSIYLEAMSSMVGQTTPCSLGPMLHPKHKFNKILGMLRFAQSLPFALLITTVHSAIIRAHSTNDG